MAAEPAAEGAIADDRASGGFSPLLFVGFAIAAAGTGNSSSTRGTVDIPSAATKKQRPTTATAKTRPRRTVLLRPRTSAPR